MKTRLNSYSDINRCEGLSVLTWCIELKTKQCTVTYTPITHTAGRVKYCKTSKVSLKQPMNETPKLSGTCTLLVHQKIEILNTY